METCSYNEKLEIAKKYLIEHLGSAPEIAIVLGSGLGNFSDSLDSIKTCSYSDIPYFHQTTVVGHKGCLIIGESSGVKIVAMQGRFHPYEGYDFSDVVFPIRLLGLWGVKKLLLSNASGGINTDYKPGDLVIIEDHINLMGQNPLVGPNLEQLGTRFPDMTHAYNQKIANIIEQAAKNTNQKITRGIYCSVLGPSYETPAEIRMMRVLGADLVGMSTVPEVIAAHHMGIEVAAISCVTNHAAGVVDHPLSHDDVKIVAESVMQKFSELMTETISLLSNK